MKRILLAALAMSLVLSLATASTPERSEGVLRYTVCEDGSVTIDGLANDPASSAVTELVIPPDIDGHPVTRVAERAFIGNLAIKSVIFPDGLEAVGAFAFFRCENLARATLPDGIGSIGDYAFYGAGLDVVTLPESLSEIGVRAFSASSAQLVVTPGSVADDWSRYEDNPSWYVPGRLANLGTAFNDMASPGLDDEDLRPVPPGPGPAEFDEGVNKLTGPEYGPPVDYAVVAGWAVTRAYYEGEFCITAWLPDGSERVTVTQDNPSGFLPAGGSVVSYGQDADWNFGTILLSPDEGEVYEDDDYWQEQFLPLTDAEWAFFTDEEFVWYYAPLDGNKVTIGRMTYAGDKEDLGVAAGRVIGMAPGNAVVLFNYWQNAVSLWQNGESVQLYAPQEPILDAWATVHGLWVVHEDRVGLVEDGETSFSIPGAFVARAGSADQFVLLTHSSPDWDYYDVTVFNEAYSAYTEVGRVRRSDHVLIELQPECVVLYGDDSVYFPYPDPAAWRRYAQGGAGE